MTETVHEIIHSYPTPDTFFLTINHPYIFTTRPFLGRPRDKERVVVP